VELALGSSRLLAISIDTLEPFAADNSGIAVLTTIPKGLPPAGFDIHAGPNVTATELVHVTKPAYPPAAKSQKVQGKVVIQATIDDSGGVREPYVLWSPNPILNAAALDAVRKWRYKPVATDGTPVDVEATMTIVFSLPTKSASPGLLNAGSY
jgi:TonB family protein